MKISIKSKIARISNSIAEADNDIGTAIWYNLERKSASMIYANGYVKAMMLTAEQCSYENNS